MKNLAIAGVIIILLSVMGLFAWTRLGLRERVARNNPSDTTPLETSPNPTSISFATPTPFPLITLPTATPIIGGRVTATPTPVAASCQYLQAEPSDGTAPLTVRLSATGLATSGTGRTYEFSFGEGEPAIGTATSVTHRYERAGIYTASLRVRDNQGNNVNLGFTTCQRTINARAVPTATGNPNTDTLPKTGPKEVVLFALLPLGVVGVFFYKKFRLI